MAKLYPCAVLGDFTVERLADTVTTAQVGRWSTNDNTNWAPTWNRSQVYQDRRSMRIATMDATNGNETCDYGVTTTDLTKHEVNNAYGNAEDDFTWCTNMGVWLMHTDEYWGSPLDATDFKMYMSDNSTPIYAALTSDLAAVDTWYWIDNTASGGTYASDGFNIKQYGFVTSSASSTYSDNSFYYLNTFTAYKAVTSSSVNGYSPNIGLEFVAENVSWSGANNIHISGLLRGDDCDEKGYQLKQMLTAGASQHQVIRNPRLFTQSLRDCGVIKPYLLYVDLAKFRAPNTYGTRKSIRVPIIITDVTVEWAAPSKLMLPITISGVIYPGV